MQLAEDFAKGKIERGDYSEAEIKDIVKSVENGDIPESVKDVEGFKKAVAELAKPPKSADPKAGGKTVKSGSGEIKTVEELLDRLPEGVRGDIEYFFDEGAKGLNGYRKGQEMVLSVLEDAGYGDRTPEHKAAERLYREKFPDDSHPVKPSAAEAEKTVRDYYGDELPKWYDGLSEAKKAEMAKLVKDVKDDPGQETDAFGRLSEFEKANDPGSADDSGYREWLRANGKRDSKTNRKWYDEKVKTGEDQKPLPSTTGRFKVGDKVAHPDANVTTRITRIKFENGEVRYSLDREGARWFTEKQLVDRNAEMEKAAEEIRASSPELAAARKRLGMDAYDIPRIAQLQAEQEANEGMRHDPRFSQAYKDRQLVLDDYFRRVDKANAERVKAEIEEFAPVAQLTKAIRNLVPNVSVEIGDDPTSVKIGGAKFWDVGSFDPKTGKAVISKASDVGTVGHEMIWHTARDWASKEAAKGNGKADLLLKKMNEYASQLPETMKTEIRRRYPDFSEDALLDEYGALRFEKEAGAKLADFARDQAEKAWVKKFGDSVKRLWLNAAGRMGMNKVDLMKIGRLSPERVMEYITDQALRGKSLGKSDFERGDKRHSFRAVLKSHGIGVEEDDNGRFVLYHPVNGRPISKKNPLAHKDLLAADSSQNEFYKLDGVKDVFNGDAREQVAKIYADIINHGLAVSKGDKGTLDAIWKWAGSEIFHSVKPNGDSQYKLSIDLTTICKKTMQLLDVVSQFQAAEGRGAIPSEIIRLYLETGRMGYQTPCPVCYVFSHWFRSGMLLQTASQAQEHFRPLLKEAHQLAEMSEGEKKSYMRRMQKELDKEMSWTKSNAKLIKKAKDDLDSFYGIFDDLSRRMGVEYKKKEAGKPYDQGVIDAIEKEIASFSPIMSTAYDIVSRSDYAGWLKSNVLKNSKGNWSLYEDFKFIEPEDKKMLFDFLQADRLVAKYPAMARFRTSKGSAGGKAIETDADNPFGEVLSGLAKKSKKEQPFNPLRNPNDTFYNPFKSYENYVGGVRDPKDGSWLVKPVKTRIEEAKREFAGNEKKMKAALDAIRKDGDNLRGDMQAVVDGATVFAAKQNLRGMQRLWSWSDNLIKFGPDMFMNFQQLQAIKSGVQSYSKQLEGARYVAEMGGYNNGSLMGYMDGYRDRVTFKGKDVDLWKWTDSKGKERESHVVIRQMDDGSFKAFYKDHDRLVECKGAKVHHGDYVLDFSDLQGIDHRGLFDLNKKLSKSGNILVGMNDTHINLALKDNRIFFVIPWHASSLRKEWLHGMMGLLGERPEGKSQDYTKVQGDGRLGDFSRGDEAETGADTVEPEELDKASDGFTVNDLWRDTKSRQDFRSAEDIEVADNGRSSGQDRYFDIRQRIMLGTATKADLEYASRDEFLSQVVDNLRAQAKNIPASQLDKAVSGYGTLILEKADTKSIYPHEYWDTGSTYRNADVNNIRYLEYCRRLGFVPKFCGLQKNGTHVEYGDFHENPGYWKTLIDRRMYDVFGKYQDLTPVDATKAKLDMTTPEGIREYFKGKDVVTREGGTKSAHEDAVRIAESLRSEEKENGVFFDPDADARPKTLLRRYDSLKDRIKGKLHFYSEGAKPLKKNDPAVKYDKGVEHEWINGERRFSRKRHFSGAEETPDSAAVREFHTRFSRRLRYPNPMSPNIMDIEANAKDKFLSNFSDRYDSLRQMEMDVAMAGGMSEKDAREFARNDRNSPYNARRRQFGLAERDMVGANAILDDYVKMLKSGAVTDADVGGYMYAMHAIPRNLQKMMDSGVVDGSGISDAEARRRIADYNGRGNAAQIKDAAKRLWDLNREFGLEYLREHGLIDSATVDRLMNAYGEDYVPLRDDFDVEGPDFGSSSGEAPVLKKAKGRFTESENPTVFLLESAMQNIMRANENTARENLARYVERHPEVGRVRVFNPAEKNLTEKNPHRGIISFRRNVEDPDTGEKVNRRMVIELYGKRGRDVAADYRGDTTLHAPQALSSITRTWASFATQLSPTFSMRNLVKDTFEVVFNNMAEMGFRPAMGFLRNQFSLASVMGGDARGFRAALKEFRETGKVTRGRSAIGDEFADFVDSGSLIGGGAARQGHSELRKSFDEIQSMVSRAGRDPRRLASAVTRVWEKYRDVIGDFNETIEMMTRFNNYRNRRARGESVEKAAMGSREDSTDFNMYGKQRWMNSVWMFSNSIAGGTMRAARTMTQGEYGRRLAVGLVAVGMIEEMADWLINHDEDEKRSARGEGTSRDYPEYDRSQTFHLHLGDKELRVPIHVGPYSLFKYAGNNVMRSVLGEIPVKQAVRDTLVEIATVASHFTSTGEHDPDLGWKHALNQTMPTAIVQPLSQLATNTDYKGQPIHRDHDMGSAKNSPNYLYARRHTPEMWIEVSKALNNLTGGGDFRKGIVDIPPEDLQYFSKQIFKNFGTDAVNSILELPSEAVDSVASGENRFELRNVPFARDFVRPVPGPESRFYETKEKVDVDRTEFGGMTGKDVNEFFRAHRHVGDERLKLLEKEIRDLQHRENGEIRKDGKYRPANVTDKAKRMAGDMKRRKMALYIRLYEKLR